MSVTETATNLLEGCVPEVEVCSTICSDCGTELLVVEEQNYVVCHNCETLHEINNQLDKPTDTTLATSIKTIPNYHVKLNGEPVDIEFLYEVRVALEKELDCELYYTVFAEDNMVVVRYYESLDDNDDEFIFELYIDETGQLLSRENLELTLSDE